MPKIGQFNTLTVTKMVDFGVYLDADNFGQVLLPKRYVPDDSVIGTEIKVFLYFDSESRLIATTLRPKAMVGECAYLKVAQVNKVGAFLDWGLPKDLLVPFGQQPHTMEVDKSYVVYVYQDTYSELITASGKLRDFLSELDDDFEINQPVNLLICARTDLGYKAVINNTHIGMLFDSQLLKPVRIGQSLPGFIKNIREDGKIDLSVQLEGQASRDDLSTRIMAHIIANGGTSLVNDKSDPDQIYRLFQVSKGNFKKALGGLLKRKLVLLEDGQIKATATAE